MRKIKGNRKVFSCVNEHSHPHAECPNEPVECSTSISLDNCLGLRTAESLCLQNEQAANDKLLSS